MVNSIERCTKHSSFIGYKAIGYKVLLFVDVF